MSHDKIDYKTTAELLGIPEGTLYAMVSKGAVPHYRIGKRLVRFSRAELTEWLKTKHSSAKNKWGNK